MDDVATWELLLLGYRRARVPAIIGHAAGRRFRYGRGMRSLLPLLFLLACTPKPADEVDSDDSAADTDTEDTDTAAAPVDADGDGFTDDVDCDDTNARINPEASERCNDLDDDCDGRTDEAATNQELLYPDLDGDGYGVEGQQQLACRGEPGLSHTTDDCDDTDAATHPDAPEEDCEDPVDRNCDGIEPTADQDGDGTPGCDDCDDFKADVHPGASNVCDDCDDATVATPLFTTDFATAPEGLSLNGDATVDGGALQLTANAEDSAGAALLTTTHQASVGLDITFTTQMCCDGGDDGITFAFLDGEVPETQVGRPGPSLGFFGLHGHAVGIDTWEDPTERSGNGITVLGDVEITIDTADLTDFMWDDGDPHDVRIVYTWKEDIATVRVSAEGTERISASWEQPDMPIRLGFTGGTSANWHEFQAVDDVSIGRCD